MNLHLLRKTLLAFFLASRLATATEPEERELVLDLGGNVTLKVIKIPAGKFLMGSAISEWEHQGIEGLLNAREGEARVEVTLTKPFFMGIHEVTVAQYQRFCEETKTEHKTAGIPQTGEHPVVNVTWENCIAFCAWLTKKSGRTASLPTEAQWEYACRAGTTTGFSFGDKVQELGDYAWFKENAEGSTHPVGLKKPNAWGLYDMHGNAWEWCSDLYAEGGLTTAVDPTGATKGGLRIRRGGGWADIPRACRSAFRGRAVPDASMWRGFRVTVAAQ